MKRILTKDLTECLVLLVPHRKSDGEGGWTEEWSKGPQLWAYVDTLFKKNEEPLYRLIIRGGIILPLHSRFLWPLLPMFKTLSVISSPTLIQSHQFLCMMAR